MTDYANKKTDHRSKNTHSPTNSNKQTSPPQDVNQIQSVVGNQAVLRLMRQINSPTVQRDSHERGCTCSSCARIQRQRDEKSQRLMTLTRQRIQRDPNEVTDRSQSFSELMKFWQGREKSGAKPEPVTGKHSSVAVQGGPSSAAAVRSLVASASPGSGGAVDFLAARVKELQGLNISSEVASQDDLIPVLAADMARKDQAKPESERQNLTPEQWLTAAKSQIESNQTTALTTSDDRYTQIKGGEPFDELHEFIHICSGQGGESALMGFQLQMNEGAVNVFSELVAAATGVKLVTRYTAETPLVKKMIALIGADGIGKLFDATFKGDVDGFFNALGAAYVALGDKKPDGKPKSFSEKKWTAEEAAKEFKSKTAAWNLGWLNPRL